MLAVLQMFSLFPPFRSSWLHQVRIEDAGGCFQTFALTGDPLAQVSVDFVPLNTFCNSIFSGAIIYLMVAIGNWISVVIVAACGAKLSLVLSGLLYV